jgi:Holliday junction resolvasome RuvABC endonuclease subunit
MTLKLGIDPGTTAANPIGYALVDTGLDTIMHYGLLKPRGDNHIPDLVRQFDDLLAHTGPCAIAIEAPWIGVNARTGLVLAQLVGGLLAVATLRGHSVKQVTPSQAKAALCNGGASKADMRKAVLLRYGVAVPSHVADAVGVALASQEWEEAR